MEQCSCFESLRQEEHGLSTSQLLLPSSGRSLSDPPGAVAIGGRCFVLVEGHVVSGTLLAAGTDIAAWVMTRLGTMTTADQRILPRVKGAAHTLEECGVAMSEPNLVFPFCGPATAPYTWSLMISRGAGSFMAAHDRWVVDAHMKQSHRSSWEHRVLSRILHLAQHEDRLNLKGLICMEYLNRRRQLLEDAHRDDPERPNFEGARHYMGVNDARSGSMADALRAHVASEFGREAAIQKERRKATEARKGPGDPVGKKKGKDEE